jgi:hypothetical protein
MPHDGCDQSDSRSELQSKVCYFYATMPAKDFELRALYEALDAQRQSRGLTWAAATREISIVGSTIGRRPVASSTIKALSSKALAEGDGVLQMLRWLGRAPETFMSGLSPDLAAAKLPSASTGKVMRFDTKKLYEALDAQRRARGLSWGYLAVETGVFESHMRGLKKGGRTAFPAVMRLTIWLKLPASEFIRLAPF